MKMKLFLFVGLLLGSLGLSVFYANTSHAATVQSVAPGLTIFAADPPAEEEGGFGDGESGTFNSSCEVKGIGWIICPVVTEISKVVDAAYGLVSAMLTVAPLLTNGGSANIYTAWTIMRNFANVVFVIGFMFIIFSQLTSIGLNNYGIKKMLPRLIVAAILVNVSYWICALAVDISNILGASLNGIFDGLKQQIGDTTTGSGLPTNPNTTQIGDDPDVAGWAGLSVAVLAGTATALYIGLSALLPALLAAAVAILTVLAVLAVRQALIVLLIVVSPLAFVAYLLPNTESLFKKWLGLFKTLLLMYPIIAMLFGAAALASAIVLATPDDGNNTAYLVAMQIMGALIAIIPLALTPIIMKTAGSVLNRVGAFVNNPNKGPFDRMRKGAEGYRKNRQQYRELKALQGVRTLPGKGLTARSRTRRGAVLASREGALKDAKTNYIADTAAENVGDNVFAKQMAGGGRFVKANEGAQNAVVASALSQQKKAFAEDVSNMEALVKVKFKDDPGAALKEALEKGDEVQAVAASNLLFKSGGGGVSKFREIVEQGETSNAAGLAAISDKLRSNITENHGQYIKQKGADIVNWAGGGSAALSSASAGALSDNDLAAQHSKSIEKAINQGNVSKIQADRMLNDPRVSANLDDGQKAALQRAVVVGSGPAPRQSAQTPSAQQPTAPQTPPRPQNPPTVQNQPQAPQPQPQQPGVLNIPHNANPGNARTSAPPNSGGEPTRPSGLWTPEDRR